MNSKILIKGNPDFVKTKWPNPYSINEILQVSEFFYDTIQGENFIGYPAAFLRLQGCTLNCRWCDTQEVWRYGNPYTFEDLFQLIESDKQVVSDSKFGIQQTTFVTPLLEKLKGGQHLILTGGSPLRQQRQLLSFFEEFKSRYSFLPYIEIENECMIEPTLDFIKLVNCWNNSPKLSNSGNGHNSYNPVLIKNMSKIENSWFKFVVTCKEDWEEIENDYLSAGIINIDQIVLMPQGSTREELKLNREAVVELAIEHNVRYSTREHIVLWDRKTGI